MAILVIDETGSTQNDLMAAVQADASAWPHLSGIRAKVQRAGRGRSGRQWDTSGLQALTVSYVLRPSAPVSEWSTIALRAGVAVVRALKSRGVETKIKWPNDIVMETDSAVAGWGGIAKVGGILGSLTRDSDGEYSCVLGIGLNLSGHIDIGSATTLAGAMAEDLRFEPGALAEGIRGELAEIFPVDGCGFERVGELVSPYCHTLGKDVVVEYPQEVPPRIVQGRAVKIDGDGALVVATEAGAERILNGDIAHTRLKAR